MHFGIVLEWNDWHQLKDKLDKKGVEFVVGPYTRYEGSTGMSQPCLFPTHAEITSSLNHSKTRV